MWSPSSWVDRRSGRSAIVLGWVSLPVKDLGVVIAVQCLNGPEHSMQTGCCCLDQQLYFLGVIYPSFPAVAGLDGLKAHASCQLTADQLFSECRGCFLIGLRG